MLLLLLLPPYEARAARQRLLSMMIASLPLPSLCGFGFDDFRAESFSLSVNRTEREDSFVDKDDPGVAGGAGGNAAL